MFENFNYIIERFFTLAISFLVVVILSIWIEKGVNLIDIEQSRPTSPLIRQKNNPNLLRFLGRYSAILLRYLELILIAGVGLFLEYWVRIWITKSYSLIVPIVMMFIPISFLTLTLCVPKKSREYFSPSWYEYLICGLLFFGGLIWLILKLSPS